jgi:hypothetical protein
LKEGLHYVYECNGDGGERYVYYCSACSCVLGVKKEVQPVGDLMDCLEGKCPGCGNPLEGSMECRFIKVDDEWANIDLAPPRKSSGRHASFHRASTLMPFSLGFPKLDLLVQPLGPGELLMLTGDGAPVAAELAALRAQLSYERGGLDSTSVFVDGGNCSDPYLFASFARQHGMDPKKALRRVVSCRAFTMYQCADLISNQLVDQVDQNASKLVVIADLLGTFSEPELDLGEAGRLLDAVKGGLDKLRAKEVHVICTLASPNRLDGLVLPWADKLVEMPVLDGTVRAKLVRGTPKPRTTCEFKMDDLLRSALVRAVVG